MRCEGSESWLGLWEESACSILIVRCAADSGLSNLGSVVHGYAQADYLFRVQLRTLNDSQLAIATITNPQLDSQDGMLGWPGGALYCELEALKEKFHGQPAWPRP
jgi:hypothetical protein